MEEPPEGNILILSVKETLDLLSTIVSRCRKISFKPIPNAEILNYLNENRELTKKDAEILSRISEGSIGRALLLAEAGFLEKRDEYIKRLLSLHHISPEETLQMAIEYGKKGKMKTSKGSENRGGEVFDLLSSWKTWYRDLVLLKGEGPDHLLINIDFREKLKKMSKSFNINHLLNSFEIIDQAQHDLIQARNLDLMLETTFLRLKRIRNETL